MSLVQGMEDAQKGPQLKTQEPMVSLPGPQEFVSSIIPSPETPTYLL